MPEYEDVLIVKFGARVPEDHRKEIDDFFKGFELRYLKNYAMSVDWDEERID